MCAIPLSILNRVYHIKFKDSTGTAFISDIEGRQYWFSAKHIFNGQSEGKNSIKIIKDNNELDVDIEIILLSDHSDIVVFRVDSIPPYIGENIPISLGMRYGQDVFFLGYPYGLSYESTFCEGIPYPLVKRAIISSLPVKTNLFYLDGNNNPGFSGGPIVSFLTGEMHPEFIGIISGYQNEPKRVFDKGRLETSQYILENSGIIHSYSFKGIEEYLRSSAKGKIIN